MLDQLPKLVDKSQFGIAQTSIFRVARMSPTCLSKEYKEVSTRNADWRRQTATKYQSNKQTFVWQRDYFRDFKTDFIEEITQPLQLPASARMMIYIGIARHEAYSKHITRQDYGGRRTKVEPASRKYSCKTCQDRDEWGGCVKSTCRNYRDPMLFVQRCEPSVNETPIYSTLRVDIEGKSQLLYLASCMDRKRQKVRRTPVRERERLYIEARFMNKESHSEAT